MNADELKALQAPIKDRYRKEPAAALITLRAQGRMGEGVACYTSRRKSRQTFRALGGKTF